MNNSPENVLGLRSRLKKTAVWAVTPNGVATADKIASEMGADVFLSEKIGVKKDGAAYFQRLKDEIPKRFFSYDNHIFIMAVGIVVRLVGPLAVHKKSDPAVVVVDDAAKFSVSLLSGHIGMANRLAEKVGELIGAIPVVTTATDVNNTFAVDAWASEKGIIVENTPAIKYINMAVLRKEKPLIYDPMGCMDRELKRTYFIEIDDEKENLNDDPLVVIHYETGKYSEKTLMLRPPVLAAGMGCNRGTDANEMEGLFLEVLNSYGFHPLSVFTLASVDLKKDERGLLDFAEKYQLDISFYNKDELNRVDTIMTPSETVQKHIGTKSVCEAAAILASGEGMLKVPKQRTKNVTLALALRRYTS